MKTIINQVEQELEMLKSVGYEVSAPKKIDVAAELKEMEKFSEKYGRAPIPGAPRRNYAVWKNPEDLTAYQVTITSPDKSAIITFRYSGSNLGVVSDEAGLTQARIEAFESQLPQEANCISNALGHVLPIDAINNRLNNNILKS